MAITYTNFLTQVRNYTEVSSSVLSDTLLDQFIRNTELAIAGAVDYDDLRKFSNSTFTPNNRAVSLPGDLLYLRAVKITSSGSEIFLEKRDQTFIAEFNPDNAVDIPKYYANWDEEGNYSPVFKTIPQTTSVSIWNFYPDPDAATMEEAEYIVERHKMSRSQLRALKNRPYFRENTIDNALRLGESYNKEWWEHAMEDNSEQDQAQRFEVLEFWGFVDTEILEQQDIDIPKELKDVEQVSVNAWVCNGQVLRLVMNPFTPAYIPYFASPFEVNPYSIFGVGIAENMDDTQTLMNGFMRMAVDNAALSGNLLIEIDETNLVPGQDLSVYPGKVFRRQGGAPGQAIFGTKFPNVSNENMQMFDKARVLADESTGFPSFAHGQTGVQGVGRTASGISMLMSAANGSINRKSTRLNSSHSQQSRMPSSA